MKVFIANFGRENLFWPLCRDRAVVAAYEDEDTWPLWEAGDREEYIEYCVANKLTRHGIPPTKSIASRWFNLPQIVSESDGDLWLHREREELWWTLTKPEAITVSTERAPWPDPSTPNVHLVQKSAQRWQKTNKRGVALLWSALHARARQFLFTEGTIQEPSLENARYARALVDGSDLSPWHARPEFRQRAEIAGRSAVTTLSAKERSIAHMVQTVEGTVKASLAGPSLQFPKRKERRFANVHALQDYVTKLLASQEGLCAVTGIPLQYEGDHDDNDLLCSLDRIDSDGHYEPNNLQIVCRFVNRWKGSDPDPRFRRLVDLVRGQ